MNTPPNAANFDERPPMPLGQYAAMVRRVNVGYELIFDLSLAVLRGLGKPDLSVLIVGAGGGQELRTFAPANPGWHLTGVDPSAQMLAIARETAEQLGIADCVELLQGTVDDLSASARYDAATCIFVLQFLPDDGAKLDLLRAVAARLRPGMPLLLVDGIASHAEELVPAWRQYIEGQGMPPEQVTACLAQIMARENVAVSEERELALLDEAGFGPVTRFYTGLVINGWIARRR